MNALTHPVVRATAGILAIVAALVALFVVPLDVDIEWKFALLDAAALLGAVAGVTTLAGVTRHPDDNHMP